MTQSEYGSRVRALITGTGRYVPDDVWTSDMVEARVAECSGGKRIPKGIIRLATGVVERRFASDGMCSSDLAARAAQRAMATAGIEPRDVDLLIFASASHDVAEPATANMVQMALGCDRAAVMDVKNACNSFLNGLDVAQAFIETGRAPRVVVAAGECLSPTIKWDVGGSDDLPSRVAALTLGDAGAACVLEASAAPERGLTRGAFESDGRHWELSTVLAGGSRYGAAPDRMFFECRTTKLQQLAVTRIPALVTDVLMKLDWALDDVALVIPHQVSRSVIERVASLLGYPLDRCMVTLDRFGNTAAASIPFALNLAIEEGRAVVGDKILLVGGAAGFSAAVVPLIL
jgi:3-oxoacyl-(acyl-carrier-protein) synthase III